MKNSQKLSLCHCGSQKNFADCCEPFIFGVEFPPTAEALMRSRYSAFVVGSMDYLLDTLHPASRHPDEQETILPWIRDAQWQGLKILAVEKGGVGDLAGLVEFIARFRQNNQDLVHHERSAFVRIGRNWKYDPAESAFLA